MSSQMTSVVGRPLEQSIGAIWISRLLWLSAYLLLFLMLAFPMAESLLRIKAALFAGLLAAAVCKFLLRRSTGLHREVLLWSIGLAALGLAFSLYGVARHTPGAIKQGELFVLWPLVYTALIGAGRNSAGLHRLSGVAVAATIFIGIYGITYALVGMGAIRQLGFLHWFSFGGQQAIGFHQGYIGLMSTGLNSLPFLFPMSATLLCISLYCAPASRFMVRRIWLWAAVTSSGVLMFLSARRALMLIAILGSFAAIGIAVYIRGSHAHKRRLVAPAVIGILVSAVVITYLPHIYPGFSLLSVWDRFISGFDFSATGSGDSAVRARQFIALGQAWLSRPLVGYGLGAVGPYVRSASVPWSYELSYMALLFHTGLIGVVAYSAGILWLSRKAVAVATYTEQSAWMVWPVLVGMYGMLIANATNPYLERFDGLWAIFWPVAVVNYHMLAAYGRGKNGAARSVIGPDRDGC